MNQNQEFKIIDGVQYLVIRSSYTDKQRRAMKKWQKNNGDKLNGYQRKRYHKRVAEDPSFRDAIALKNKENYHKRKAKRLRAQQLDQLEKESKQLDDIIQALII